MRNLILALVIMALVFSIQVKAEAAVEEAVTLYPNISITVGNTTGSNSHFSLNTAQLGIPIGTTHVHYVKLRVQKGEHNSTSGLFRAYLAFAHDWDSGVVSSGDPIQVATLDYTANTNWHTFEYTFNNFEGIGNRNIVFYTSGQSNRRWVYNVVIEEVRYTKYGFDSLEIIQTPEGYR